LLGILAELDFEKGQLSQFPTPHHMPDDYPLKQNRDLARAVAASVLDRPVAEVTDGTPLDSDDIDFVAVELSLAGIEIDRHGIETVGDLVGQLQPNAAMILPSESALALRQADQARTDFALLESNLEIVMGQLAKLPTRAYLCRTLLLAMASVWTLLAVLLLR
jgi:hypothetical protein